MRVIEDGAAYGRLSESAIWSRQVAFFEEQGVGAWSTGTVPHYVTNHPVIASAYARVSLAFLGDWHPPGTTPDTSEPMHIIELGAGSGRFAHHFLRDFLRRQAVSPWCGVDVRYVMTDIAPRTIAYWRAHPSLRPLVEAGRLDFAVFDAVSPAPLELLESGVVLGPGPLQQPAVVIANYVLDGLPQDSFSIDGGELHERLVSVSSRRREGDRQPQGGLWDLELAWTDHPVGADHYADPDLDRVLSWSAETRGEAAFLLPTAAIRCFEHLRRLTGDRLLILTADKGAMPGERASDRVPHVAVHGSCSLAVDYEAIGEYVRGRGGGSLLPSHQAAHLTIAAYLFGEPPGGWRGTVDAYAEAIDRGGPDDFYALKGALVSAAQALTLQQLLAFIRLSGWDGKVLMDVLPALLAQVGEADESLRRDVVEMSRRVWAAHYPIGEPADLGFALGALLYRAREYAEAIVHLDHSSELWGPDPTVSHLRACCHKQLGEIPLALAGVDDALSLDPGFQPAHDLGVELLHRSMRSA